MELFGIILSIPAAIVASLAYCSFLRKIIAPIDLLRKVMWVASAGVLFLLAVEIMFLVTIGPVHTRASIGPVFYLVHLAVFFLGAPSLANVIVLRNPRSASRSLWWVVPFCTIFAITLILLQYGVSEALYGVDGTDGPFSKRQIPLPVTESVSCSPSLRRSEWCFVTVAGVGTSAEIQPIDGEALEEIESRGGRQMESVARNAVANN